MLFPIRLGLYGSRAALDASAGGGGGTPTLSYVTTAGSTHSTTHQTITGISIGTASATRRVFFIWWGAFGDASQTVSTFTVTPSGGGAITGTVHFSAGDNGTTYGAAIASCVVSTATTADVDMNCANAFFSDGRFSVYTVDNSTLSSTTPTGTINGVTATSSITESVTGSAGGFLLGVSNGDFDTAPPTITGATEDFTGYNGGSPFSKNSISAGSNSVTATTNSALNRVMVMAAFR